LPELTRNGGYTMSKLLKVVLALLALILAGGANFQWGW
jgi:hypothetical protein